MCNRQCSIRSTARCSSSARLEETCSSTHPIHTRTVLAVLPELDANSGTGPDHLSARVLCECAKELARPIAILCRILLSNSRWPLCWRLHWIHALHKRDSKANTRHYRGIHLTCHLSKVVERVLGRIFLRWARDNNLFGPNQYAYTTARSHKDALTVNICSWLWSLESGNLVALYCSDVSGAFDRVRATRLKQKLRCSGLHPQVVLFLGFFCFYTHRSRHALMPDKKDGTGAPI